MGELLKQLRKDNMMAMKEHDTVKKGVLGMVISAIALAEKEKGVELSKEDELTYVQRELKQTRDSLQQTPASRTDLIEETKKKIEILESYLPKQLSAEEIKEAIEKILSEKGLEPVKKGNAGNLTVKQMKEMMAQYKGQVDGKLVNQVLGTLLH